MAQLLDTTVNGDLEVTGNIISSLLKQPSQPSHVINKGYLDEVNAIYKSALPPIGGNANGSGSWKKFTTDDFSVELKKGKYLINLSAGFSSSYTGYVTMRLLNNGTEIDPNFHSSKQTVPVSPIPNVQGDIEPFFSNANSTVLFELDSDANCVFRPEAFGTVTWTGRYARINIIRIA